MDNFETTADALAAIDELKKSGPLPAVVRAHLDRLEAAQSSVVDHIVQTAEIIFANRDALSQSAREVGSALFLFAGRFGYNQINEDSRAQRASNILLGATGDTVPAITEFAAPLTTPEVVVQ